MSNTSVNMLGTLTELFVNAFGNMKQCEARNSWIRFVRYFSPHVFKMAQHPNDTIWANALMKFTKAIG